MTAAPPANPIGQMLACAVVGSNRCEPLIDICLSSRSRWARAANAPAGHPATAAKEIVERAVLASPSERSSVFGSAGKEATVAPNGVVVNAVRSR
jgi:hypothetical protein